MDFKMFPKPTQGQPLLHGRGRLLRLLAQVDTSGLVAVSGLESDFLRLHWLKKDVTEYNQDMKARVHSIRFI
jgi:hypothetical protein